MQSLTLTTIALACLLATGASAFGLKCIICEEVLEFGLKFLEKNNTEHALEHAFGNVCSYIYHHDSLKQENCDAMIANYINHFIGMVEKKVHPTEACTIIGICGGKIEFLKSILFKLLPIRNASQNKLPSSSIYTAAEVFAMGVKKVECYTCTSLMNQLHKHKDQTIQFLANYAEIVCDYPIFNSIPNCEQLVDEYIGKTIINLDNSQTVHEFCGRLGFCVANATFNMSSLLQTSIGQELMKAIQMEQQLAHALDDTDNCKQCKVFVEPVNGWINNPAIKTTIDQDIDGLCSKFPQKERCIRQLQSYANRIFEFLDKHTQPQFICQTLGVCSANIDP